MKKTAQTLVYMKGGKVTLWQKHWLWHKWIPKPPKPYSDTEKRLGIFTDYSLGCFWGTQEEAPEKTGYILIGELAEVKTV